MFNPDFSMEKIHISWSFRSTKNITAVPATQGNIAILAI